MAKLSEGGHSDMLSMTGENDGAALAKDAYSPSLALALTRIDACASDFATSTCLWREGVEGAVNVSVDCNRGVVA
jgi:hypothetical protein